MNDDFKNIPFNSGTTTTLDSNASEGTTSTHFGWENIKYLFEAVEKYSFVAFYIIISVGFVLISSFGDSLNSVDGIYRYAIFMGTVYLLQIARKIGLWILEYLKRVLRLIGKWLTKI